MIASRKQGVIRIKEWVFFFSEFDSVKKVVFGGLGLEIKVLESGVFLGTICG